MADKVVFRAPVLSSLGSRLPGSRKLAALYGVARRFFPRVERVAVALYDAKTGRAGTFLYHGDRPTPLAVYEASLDAAPSLKRVFRSRRIRVVNDMEVFAEGTGEHTKAIRAAGFKSSAAFPILAEGRVEGVVFFNSRSRNAFPPDDVPLLEVFATLAGGLATARLRSARMLSAALRSASGMVHLRDLETGNHLDRMGRYSRVIAQDLSRGGRAGFDDERVQYISSFAPLHDVGKIGIPDRVLLKPGPLDPAERRLMRTHAMKGRRIVDEILRNFGAGAREHANALRQIAQHHHEAMDGSGYPDHLRGRRIPIEARIVAVADVFDALTSARPYKPAWTTDRAFETLRELSRTKLDRDCVRALIKNRADVERIRRRFLDAAR